MLDKEVLISIFKKLLEQAKNSYNEFNTVDGKIGDGDLGITIKSGLEEINNNMNRFNDDLGSNFMICSQAFVKKSGSSFGTLIAFSFMNIFIGIHSPATIRSGNSSLLRFSEKFNGEIPKNIIPDVAASYQKAIVNSLLNKLKLAYEKTNIKTIVIGGGVAANKSLREKTSLIFKDSTVLFPSLQLCTDNAAMIAFLGEKLIKKGFKSNLSIGVYPNLKLDESLK